MVKQENMKAVLIVMKYCKYQHHNLVDLNQGHPNLIAPLVLLSIVP